MSKINWQYEGNREWSAFSEKEEYVLNVIDVHFNNKWEWTLFGGGGEYKLDSDLFEEEEQATTADEAKARAEAALNKYLETQKQPA